MDEKEIKEKFDLCLLSDPNGIPIGVYSEKVICMPWEQEPQREHFSNNNLFILGSPSTGKKRALIVPQSMQHLKHGESLIVNDPKGDLCKNLSPIAKKYDYKIKKLVCDPAHSADSNGWDCLKIIRESSDPLAAATIFADAVLDNIEDPHSNSQTFWKQLDKDLLTALVLYVAKSPAWTPLADKNNAKRDLKEVCALLSSGFEYVEEIFAKKNANLDDLCFYSYRRWHGSSHCKTSFLNLSAKFEILKNSGLLEILSADDIDIKRIGEEKTIVFINVNDQNPNFCFVNSLFLGFAFHELTVLADKSQNGRLDVPVRFVLDDFPSCGVIPDFTRKISAVYPRGIGFTISMQGIDQLKTLYPDGEWESIINSCSIKILLGTNEKSAADYFSDGIGDRMDQSDNPDALARKMLRPEEIMCMGVDHQIVLVEGSVNIIDCSKYDAFASAFLGD